MSQHQTQICNCLIAGKKHMRNIQTHNYTMSLENQLSLQIVLISNRSVLTGESLHSWSVLWSLFGTLFVQACFLVPASPSFVQVHNWTRADLCLISKLPKVWCLLIFEYTGIVFIIFLVIITWIYRHLSVSTIKLTPFWRKRNIQK